MSEKSNSGSWPAACWAAIIFTGAMGVVGGYAAAYFRQSEEIKTVQAQNVKLQKNVRTGEHYVMASEMVTHVVMTLATSNEGGLEITLPEAEKLIKRLNEMGAVDPVVKTQFVDVLNHLKSLYDEDMADAPEDVASWRSLAKYWKAKYKAK